MGKMITYNELLKEGKYRKLSEIQLAELIANGTKFSYANYEKLPGMFSPAKAKFLKKRWENEV